MNNSTETDNAINAPKIIETFDLKGISQPEDAMEKWA